MRHVVPVSLERLTCVLQQAIVATAILLFAVPARQLAADDADFPPALTQFVPSDKTPVFTAGPAGAWDARIRERGWILREGETWHLWYTGYDGTPNAPMMLGYATSADGLNWVRSPHNPIYREQWLEDMMVVKQADTYFMFAE